MRRRPGLRLRALDALLSRASISRLSDAQIERMQRTVAPRNRLVDTVFGARPPGVATRELEIAVDGGTIPARLYSPPGHEAADGALPVVLFFHGGGFVFGDVDGHDAIAGAVCESSGAAVVSVGYRLAPAYIWPVQVDDAYAALAHVHAHAADLGVDPDRIAVAGDSAGGTLSIVVALMSRDRCGPALRAQALSYPAADMDREDYPSMHENADAPVLTLVDVERFRDVYLPDETDRTHPYASPSHADLHGLPPALVQVAEHDPLRDAGVAFAAALTRADVPVRQPLYVGMPHGFLSFPGVCDSAPQAIWELGYFLRTALADDAEAAATA